MAFRKHETAPVKRSSEISFAFRWKQRNSKWWIIAFSLIAFSTLFFILMHSFIYKTVTIAVDGEQFQVKTASQTVKDVLEEQEVELGEYDLVTLPLDSEIKQEDVIEVRRAKPLQLTIGGETQTVYTAVETVQDVLQQFHITVDEDDKVFPTVDTAVSETDKVTVIQIDRQVVEVEKSIPFQTVEQQDATLAKGKQKLIQQGKEGRMLVEIEQIAADGEVVTENVLSETVLEESMDEIVAIGTRNPVTVLSASSPMIDEVTIDGNSFAYRQVLNDVLLTAYDAGEGSTGKTEDHPYYGKTYTGTTVTEGRTIAVDPKVIPLGWWVYIEGYGFRKAEDIGSAVKGKHIDIYYDSEQVAIEFGVKKGYTVYVIGPEKP